MKPVEWGFAGSEWHGTYREYTRVQQMLQKILEHQNTGRQGYGGAAEESRIIKRMRRTCDSYKAWTAKKGSLDRR